MKYLVDTNVLIDYSKNQASVVTSLLRLIKNDAEIGICPIILTEFYSGIGAQQHVIWDEFFDALSYWSISPQAAKRAGMYRYSYRKKGIALATADALIASVAWYENAILLTANTKDFPMEDITVRSLADQKN
jgi:predicted nucleic acid-binding protein